MEAVRANKFGDLTRTKYEWHPAKDLCKRFNVPDPYPESCLIGAPGITRKVKNTNDYALFDLGLPNTENEIASRKKPSRFDMNVQDKVETGPIQQIKTQTSEAAPLDFLRALFEETGVSDDESSDELLNVPVNNNKPIKHEPTNTSLPSELSKIQPHRTKEKIVTVLDIVNENDFYGPAPPPPDTLSSHLPPNANYGGETESISSDDSDHQKKKKRHKRKKHKKREEKKFKKSRHD